MIDQQQTVQPALAPSFTPVQPGMLQRTCACGQHTGAGGECAECKKKREGTLQRAAIGTPPVGQVPPIVHDVLRSSGQPLDAATRAFMEPRFGHDFSGVRVHADARATESAHAVQAHAYTVGQDVVFGANQYAPNTPAGGHLLAHELTHVVQQSTQPSSTLLRMANNDTVTEHEAERISDQIVRSENMRPSVSDQPVRLQRQASGATPAQPTQAPAPPQAAPTSSIAGMQVAGKGFFDAELDRRAALDPRRRSANEPCRLTLTIRVRFNFNDTQTPNRWTPAEQARWQNEFIRTVTNRWSFRFLLVPSQTCPSEPCQLATALLNVVPVTSNPHNTMNVLYEKPDKARSGVGGGGTRSTLYRPDIDRDGSDLRTNQATASHEIGHMLGLPHVHCSTNDDDCYGTNREESADVMGRGEIVTERDYLPFVTAMQQITGCSWQVRDGRRGPLFRNVSTGLGITLGLAGGLIGGILGAAGGAAGAVFGALGGAALGGLLGYAIGTALD